MKTLGGTQPSLVLLPKMPQTCCHICPFLLRRASARKQRDEFLANELVSGAISAGVALCCCPLGLAYLVLCSPFSLLAKCARSLCSSHGRRRRGHAREVSSTSVSDSATRRIDFSFGFVVNGRCVNVVCRADFEICACSLRLRLPEGLKLRVAEFTRKALRRSKKTSYDTDPELDFDMLAPMAPLAGSVQSRCGSASGDEEEEEEQEMTKGGGLGFEHPFWREHFECSQLGFWRGLDLSS